MGLFFLLHPGFLTTQLLEVRGGSHLFPKPDRDLTGSAGDGADGPVEERLEDSSLL